jgi:hypothetical protein
MSIRCCAPERALQNGRWLREVPRCERARRWAAFHSGVCQHLTKKLAQTRMGCVAKEFVRRGVDKDAAAVHEDDSIGDPPRKRHFVGHAEHRHALGRQRNHRVEDLLNHFRVQRRCWLVKEHNARTHA